MIVVAANLLAVVTFVFAFGISLWVFRDNGPIAALLCFILGISFWEALSFGKDFEKNMAIEAAIGGEVEDAVCYYPKGCSLLIKAKNGESHWIWAPVREEAGR